MVYEQRQQAAVNDVLAWLEDELRETKAQISRLRQDADQTSGRLSELTSGVRAAEDGAKSVTARLDEMPQFAHLIAQVRDTLLVEQEESAADERRLTEGLRIQQIEAERLRQELNGTYRRIELLERAIEGWGGRFERLDEADHHLQEAITLLRQRYDEIDHRQESAEAHAARDTDSLKRYEHDLGRLATEIERLHRQDALAGERSQISAEMTKRLGERIDGLAAEVASQADIFEKLDLLQVELHRIENRLAAAERVDEGQRDQLDDHQRSFGLLEGKDRGFSERLSHLQEDLVSYRAQVAEQFQRLHQSLDRQKRRQLEDLERDLRELKLSAFRPSEDASEGITSSGGTQGLG